MNNYENFMSLCQTVRERFSADWEREAGRAALEIQKRAIIGYEKEKNYYLDRISEILEEQGFSEAQVPPWYSSLAEGIYHENWGLAGLSEWFGARFSGSSSAKLIGGRIYFLENGRMQLKPQRISEDGIDRILKALLLLSPGERMDKSYYELYLLDGTRVTVFTEPMAKKSQTSMIFRRYLVPEYSFEEQAARGTIPFAAAELFKAMVACGFNVAFIGAVRTAKTTFLSTWQSYEDPALEGVMVETDPEIPMERILPGAPVIQLVADGEALGKITKNLLRSDADYFIMAEARDGIALDTAVRIAAKGTKRMKITFHSRDPYRFPQEVAAEMIKYSGGGIEPAMHAAANAFDFIFHFVQLKDKSKKLLKGIYSMEDGKEINIRPICEYDYKQSCWHFSFALGQSHIRSAEETDPEAFELFKAELKKLEDMGCVR